MGNKFSTPPPHRALLGRILAFSTPGAQAAGVAQQGRATSTTLGFMAVTGGGGRLRGTHVASCSS